MNDALLVRVLNGLADLNEKLQPLFGIQLVLIAVAVMGMPRTSSITKNGRPVSVAPASSTLAMFGWSISASACRSASKRPDDFLWCPCRA
jgi:hypothetical protein